LYYREHTDEFREQEQVCASHILIKVKGSAEAKDGHDEAEARRLAEALQQKARAGADFAELAKASSEDQGSAPSGGDLGCFPRGRMVPEFDNVAFDEALAPGQISELAKTNFGFHVIRVQARKQDTVQPLTQARERIRQSLTGERLQTLSAERTDAVTVALSKGRTLEQVAAELGLTVQKSPPFARGEAPPALSPALGARAFALKPGQVDREGGQVGRGYAFVALGEVQPSRLPKLEEAQERVKADLADRKAFESARARAAELRARAEKEGLDRAAAASGLVRKETPALVGRGQPLAELGSSAALDEAVFALADKSLSEPLRTPTGWAVVRVIERKAADPAAFERERATLVGTLRSERRSRLFQAYLGQARERYKVERRSDVFRRLVG
jgi:peptidyl-prolyl cis-trans isomerase D